MPFRELMALALFLASTVPSAKAAIVDFKQLKIDFTHQTDASGKSTWAEPEKINSDIAGLGWDGTPSSSRSGWFRTRPFPLGLSWRPTISASIKATVQATIKSFKLNDGTEFHPWRGQLYVRYSPDTKNWSSWQALQADDKLFQTNHAIVFQGYIQIPDSDRREYEELIQKYSRMDVPWGSDEEAAVRWIISHDKKFFEKSIPFIGYVQFLYETDFYGGQRIAAFSADIGYGMSGIHMVPKDPSNRPDMQKTWQYKAETP